MRFPLLVVLVLAFGCVADAKPPTPTPSPSPSPTPDRHLKYTKAELDSQSKPALVTLIQRIYSDLKYIDIYWKGRIAEDNQNLNARAATLAETEAKLAAAEETRDTAEAQRAQAQAQVDLYANKANQIANERDKLKNDLTEIKKKLDEARTKLIYLRLILVIVLALVVGLFGIRLIPLIAPILGPYAALAPLVPVAMGLLAAVGGYFALVLLP